MKKRMVAIVAFFIFAGSLSAERGRLILNLYGVGLNMAKNDFTSQDSRNKVYFEAKAAYAFSGNLYVWASHGYFPLRDNWQSWEKKSSFEPDALVERTLGKRVLAGGCGLYIGYFEPKGFGVRAEVGLCSITNAIDSTVSDMETDEIIRSVEARQRGLGLRGNLAFTYGLYRNIFAEISAGYMYAADKIDGVRSNLGGLHAALGLGIQL